MAILEHPPIPAAIDPGLVGTSAEPTPTTSARVTPIVWAVTRVSLGFVFLWAFLDKTFGLGFATPSAKAWISAGSPTTGFLKGVEGPFAGMFHSMAGAPVVDWLFMMALLGIGIGLISGVAMRVTAASATALLVFMWMASLPLQNNPVLDDHLVYALVIIGLAVSRAGDQYGFGRAWARLPLVARMPILR